MALRLAYLAGCDAFGCFALLVRSDAAKDAEMPLRRQMIRGCCGLTERSCRR
jgi:hypothetical protein